MELDKDIGMLGKKFLGHSVEVQSLLPYAQRSFPPGHITTLNVNPGSTPGVKTQNFFSEQLVPLTV